MRLRTRRAAQARCHLITQLTHAVQHRGVLGDGQAILLLHASQLVRKGVAGVLQRCGLLVDGRGGSRAGVARGLRRLPRFLHQGLAGSNRAACAGLDL